MVPGNNISEDDLKHVDKPDLSAPTTIALDDEPGVGVWWNRELRAG